MYLLGAELYLQPSPKESARLPKVSHELQCESGMKSPGNASLTAQGLGDVEPWGSPAMALASHDAQPALLAMEKHDRATMETV